MPFFAAPWFLAAGLVATIPIALHLLHRRRPRPVPFSTLRFLQEAIARTRRSRNITNVVTLLLRVLIILCLAAAFARPRTRSANWLPAGRRTIIIVLDGSLSMRYRDGEKSCFQHAVDWGLSLVNSLEAGDRAGVIVPGRSDPLLVFPPNSDHEAVAHALAGAEPGYGHVAWQLALTDLVKRLPENLASEALELHLFSDFQLSGWPEDALPEIADRLRDQGVLVFANDVRPDVAVNAGFETVAFHPPAILGAGGFQVRSQIRCSRDLKGSCSLAMALAERELARRTFQAVPTQTVTQAFTAKTEDGDAGVVGRLTLGDDGLTEDNVLHFSLPRAAAVPVVVTGGGNDADARGRDTFFVSHAIEPGGKATGIFKPRELDWTSFAAGRSDDPSALIVCNPGDTNDGAIGRIEAIARQGGTAILYPGNSGALEGGLARFGPLRTLAAWKEEFPREQRMALLAGTPPSLLEKRIQALMPTLGSMTVRRRLVFDALPDQAEVSFRYADGKPFLIRVPLGHGHLWVASVSANRDWADWPLSPLFVVVHQELLKASAGKNLPSLMVSVGESLPLHWPEDAEELEFRLRTPSGHERLLTARRTKATGPVLLKEFDEPGLYQLERGGKRYTIAANPPGVESDLAYPTRGEILTPFRGVKAFHAGSWEEQQEGLATIRHGRPLWPGLLLLAFLLGIAEELFANVRSRTHGMPDNLRRFLTRGMRSA